VCVFPPRTDLLGDVGQVVELSEVLRRGDVAVGFDDRRQLLQARRRRLHQPLARANHAPVLLRPIGVLVASRLLVDVADVTVRVLGLGQRLEGFQNLEKGANNGAIRSLMCVCVCVCTCSISSMASFTTPI